MTAADIFLLEDSASVLASNFRTQAFIDLMVDGANAVLAAEGDNFDAVGFFINFVPHHQIGVGVSLTIENTVSSGIGRGIFNNRPFLGIAGDNVEHLVFMWNESDWAPNDRAMLVLGHEFEHLWGIFLNPLLDGRPLQGPVGCGEGGHWSWKIDSQGSGMLIREWIGSNPAVLGGDCDEVQATLCNNADIGNSPTGLGAVYSYTDLYLMGFVSAAEMDAGNSELRFMDNSDCVSPYNGPISTFTSADIVASNGVRIPSSVASQHGFRTAWVMIHLPGAPPTAGQLNNVVNILNRWSEAWAWSTLGRGTMDNRLQVPCPGADGDMNGDTKTDGRDIQGFVDGIVAVTADPNLICSGDFSNSGGLDLGDVPGMVAALLAP